MSIVITTHTYEVMEPSMRPQDPHLDGTGLRFETLEHGGEWPDTMPQAIRMTDADGQFCTYLPVQVGGKVVRHMSFGVNRNPSPEAIDRKPPPPPSYYSRPVVWPFLRRLFRRQRSA